jgi:hypothetical protein
MKAAYTAKWNEYRLHIQPVINNGLVVKIYSRGGEFVGALDALEREDVAWPRSEGAPRMTKKRALLYYTERYEEAKRLQAQQAEQLLDKFA